MVFTSCVKEDFVNDNNEGGYRMVETSLRLSVAGAIDGRTGTKAVDDPADSASTKIRNLNILQFNGTSEDSRIIGEVRYLTDTADPTDEEHYMNLNQIRMAESEGALHTVVFLANVFTKVPQVKTLKDMKDYLYFIENEADLFGYEGDGEDFPEGTTYYQRLSGVAVSEITNGTNLTAALRRSMAKLNIRITNTGKDNLVIDSLQICNVSQKTWFLTNYTYFDTTGQQPYKTKELFPGGFVDSYDPEYPARMNYDSRPWPAENEGKGNASFTFYVPANQRGICDDDDKHLPSEKNRCPHTDGATYVRIYGRYGENQDIHIVYTYYLGENLRNDFNLCPNKSYTYNFVIDGRGNSTVDDRVDDMNTVDFEVDANCYILNPPLSHTRSYTFNAIHRPNIFWGDRYGLRNIYPNYKIGHTNQWKARILWSDFEMTKEEREAFLTRSSGDGSGIYMSDSQRIKVTVPAGMKSGNVIIGLYLPDEENSIKSWNNIIWSWHLWITDYRPDDIVGHAPVHKTIDENGNATVKYIYEVTEGEVHRYDGSSWQDPEGRYYNGYVMDRNLGARDAKNMSIQYAGLKYQFGRKDPISSGKIYTYDSDGVVTMTNHIAINSNDARLDGLNGSHVPYFVNHPLEYIKDGDYHWTSNDIFNPTEFNKSILWLDPYYRHKTISEEGEDTNEDKSIFDPCPPGWCLPESMMNDMPAEKNHWLVGFKGDTKGYNTTDETVNMQYDATSYGMGPGHTYFPRGFLTSKDDPDAPRIFFPEQSGGVAYYYSANPHSIYGSKPAMLANAKGSPNHFSSYYGYKSQVKNSTGGSNRGFVRCIRKDY